MKAYIAFLKKELCEMSRTYKLLIMGAVFFLLGVMNPLTAKFMPEILSSFMPEGMKITITEPTAMDSWVQFFKNVPQTGLIVLVIVFSGMMANELSKGTLINVLTKGLPRKTVILSKFTAAGIVWTGAYWMCFGISCLYTHFFWKAQTPNLLFSVFCLWIFGMMLISVVILGGVLFSSNYGSLLFAGLVVVVLLLLNIPPKFQEYNPMMLAVSNTMLLAEAKTVSDFIIPLFITCAISVLTVLSTILVFNKKKI